MKKYLSFKNIVAITSTFAILFLFSTCSEEKQKNNSTVKITIDIGRAHV